MFTIFVAVMECGGNLLEGGMNTKEYLTKVCDWRWRQVTGEWAAQEILQENGQHKRSCRSMSTAEPAKKMHCA